MVALRTVFFYLLLIGVIRLMGKRQVAQMEPSEFAVTMLVANLASIALEELETPVWVGAAAMATVLLLEYALSLMSLRSVRLRRVLCGKPVILIENGKILQRNLRSTRVTLDELTELLRGKNVLSPETVQYAILETNGNLSVFPFPEHRPASAKDANISPTQQLLPYTIVADGYVYRNNLELAGKDDRWLQKQLRKRDASVATTWLMTVDSAGNIFWQEKEQEK